ncbi:MAG: amylo-alpha-1,6-glucosidase [Paludibacteraceae bacterium]|nr:amylo-alpha-1,6-glucosidase [Paludibacteraceae bacterium]
MDYLNFDKSVLANLEKSLTKEMLRTNRSGAYNSTTLVDCNTRKYHGQLVVPLPEIDGDNYVLLSSLDETIIQHSAEFNLGVHQYKGGQISPNGHKYIREFSCNVISKTIYRVGGVIISKERLMVKNEPRTIIKYTLLDAHSATTIRFKPFLAFRSVNALSKENENANTDYQEVKNGIKCKLYEPFPFLYMQFSKAPHYIHTPYWYKGLEYEKEQERGYDYLEDLMVPGYFEIPIKKGESIYFTTGLSEIAPRNLKTLWDTELNQRNPRSDMFNCLKNAARQFAKQQKEGTYLLAGYPWFKTRARDEFISLPGCTLSIDDNDMFNQVASSAVTEIKKFIEKCEISPLIEEIDMPDALLWFVWAIQMYYETNKDDALAKYKDVVLDIVNFYKSQRHPNATIRDNGLIYVTGSNKPMTWMNAVEDEMPITPRSGYVVEHNALWYNALCFAAEITSDTKLSALTEKVKESFVNVFWNGFYLYDYVDGTNRNVEVRPNMIYAVSLPYSPLERSQQKSVVDICTRELLTAKGLRSLSPKSGFYRPNYVGGMKERNRNYHNGPVWPYMTGAYCEAYLKLHKMGGVSFVERLMIGMEAEMKKLCVGTLSELFDGNPPYKGHGAMSYAPTVAEVLRILKQLM